MADVNGDGFADIVGFGYAGAYASLGAANGSFGPLRLAINDFGFGPSAGGWYSNDVYPRELADVNGDGMADIVGFGYGGVYVALSEGNGQFAPKTLVSDNFGAGPAAGGFSSQNTYPRELADVYGTGRDDIVAFGYAGVYVSQNLGNGQFGSPQLVVANFGAGSNAGGWTSQDAYPRFLADVNGDGLPDIVGFGAGGVYVSLNLGGGNFGSSRLVLAAFGSSSSAGSWTSQTAYPRMLADVNGDGLADIIGFGSGGVYVSLANQGGNFAAPASAADLAKSDPTMAANVALLTNYMASTFAPGAGSASQAPLTFANLPEANSLAAPQHT
jgi:hypothetical protein